MKISEKIRIRMAIKNWSQSELGRISGIHQQKISRWTRGIGVPSADEVVILARALECDVKDLLSDEEELVEEEKAAS